jgi:hypothetical protein
MFRELYSRDLGGETVDGVPIVISGNPMAMNDFFESDISQRNLIGDADVLEPIAVNDESVFAAFGASSEDNFDMVETTSFNTFVFDCDIDESGHLSRLDAEKIISYLSDLFRSMDSADFSVGSSDDFTKMDIDGDAQLTPLDALIVINELNRTGTLSGVPASESARLARNSTLIAGDVLDGMASEDAGFVFEEEISDKSRITDVAYLTDLAITDFAPPTEVIEIACDNIPKLMEDGVSFLRIANDSEQFDPALGLDESVSQEDEVSDSVDDEWTDLRLAEFELDGKSESNSGLLV